MTAEPVSLEEPGKDQHCISCMYQLHQVWESKGLELAIPVYKGTRRQCLQQYRQTETENKIHEESIDKVDKLFKEMPMCIVLSVTCAAKGSTREKLLTLM